MAIQINNVTVVELLRAQRKQELKDEGLRRIQGQLPGIDSIDTLMIIREFWLSLVPAAKSPTSTFQNVIDIYQVARTELTFLTTATEAELQAYDAVTSPAWPVV